ncbi:MAG: hypothetical protein Q3976_07895 [Corynebacterium sp.]|nr:hypothetical protein [Corynebacterium sp.]
MTHPQHPRAPRSSQSQPQGNTTPQQPFPEGQYPEQQPSQGMTPNYKVPGATPHHNDTPQSPVYPQGAGKGIPSRPGAGQPQNQPQARPHAQRMPPGHPGAPTQFAHQLGAPQPTGPASQPKQQPAKNKGKAHDPFNTPWYKKPMNWVFALLALSVIVFLIGLVAILTTNDEEGSSANNAASTSTQPASEVMAPLPQNFEVTYRIVGTSTDVAVTYNNGEQTNAQEQGVGPGWEITTPVSESFGAYLFTTNGIDEEGETTCQVEANGVIIAEDSATGPLSEAFCNPSNADLAAAFE